MWLARPGSSLDFVGLGVDTLVFGFQGGVQFMKIAVRLFLFSQCLLQLFDLIRQMVTVSTFLHLHGLYLLVQHLILLLQLLDYPMHLPVLLLQLI